ncbi:hypothetical protein HYU23_00955 [Candidatus Woesearchaeota archaeon]|nr:hypothetical protein [Candidatus Woesearchaeota archaeon]
MHAKEKMIGFGIEVGDVRKAILYGSKSKQTDGFLSCYKYYCVAYKMLNKKVYKIKTVYIRT